MGRWGFTKIDGYHTSFVTDKNSELWARCEALEYRTFMESGYIEPNEEQRLVDYDDYLDAEFLAIFEPGAAPGEPDRLIGAFRNIYARRETKMRPGLFPTVDSAEELKIFPEDLETIMAFDPRRVVDMASGSILPEHRDSRVSKLMVTTNLFHFWEQGVRHIVMCADTPIFRKFNPRGLLVKAIGPSTQYMGSLTTAMLIDTYSIAQGWHKIFIPICRAKGLVRRTGV